MSICTDVISTDVNHVGAQKSSASCKCLSITLLGVIFHPLPSNNMK